jgi:hypothetical protein
LKTIRSFIKYVLPLGIAGLMLWLVFKDLDLKELFLRLGSADFRWVALSIVFAFSSHYMRAYRWTMMLEPIGFHVKTPRAFWALMGGYVANMAVPRMGEVTRCLILKKTDGVAVPASFGNVIIERVIDLLILLCVILLALILQFGRISAFFSDTFFKNKTGHGSSYSDWIIILSLILLASLLAFWSQWNKIKKTSVYKRLRPIMGEMITGLLSIRKIKNKTVFFILTFLIWLLYYFMSYIMIFSYPATSNLSPLAGLVILMAGGLGMSAPVQGGIGTYHAFVSSALILYGISREDGVLYATLMHTSQFIFIVFTGSISLLISLVIRKRNVKNEQGSEQNIHA